MLVPLPGGRPAAVNWSRGTGFGTCKYRARWGVSASLQLRRL